MVHSSERHLGVHQVSIAGGGGYTNRRTSIACHFSSLQLGSETLVARKYGETISYEDHGTSILHTNFKVIRLQVAGLITSGCRLQPDLGAFAV